VEFTWLAYKPALLGERILRSTVGRDTEAHNNRGHVSDPVSHFSGSQPKAPAMPWDTY